MRRRTNLLAACLLPLTVCSGALLSGCALFEGDGSGRKYVVFFNAGSAVLDEAAHGVVGKAADAAANRPADDVMVEGFVAARGSLSADEALSAQRAEIVAAALRSDGVAANRIHVSARGPSKEDPGVGARRVEIDFSK